MSTFIRQAFETYKRLFEARQAAVAAGHYILQGPSLVGYLGDGVTEAVPTCRDLQKRYFEAQASLLEGLDAVIKSKTGFAGSFAALVDAQRLHGYVPTIRPDGDDELAVLADAYDFAVERQALPSECYRGVQAQAAKPRTVHLLDDLGVYKATLKRNFADNDRGAEFDRDRELLARRTQRYTLEEAEVLLGWCSTSHDDCVDENPEDYSPIEVYTARQKLLRRDDAVARLEALKAAVP